MSSSTSNHDVPDTGDSHRRKSTPGYLVFANTCGLIGVMLSGILAFYYFLIGAGYLPQPVLGVIPIWTMTIIILGAVKIVQWAADAAANRVLHIVEHRFAALLKLVDRVSEDALHQAHESGQWKGIASELRRDMPGDTTNVVNGGFGRRGGNAN